MGQFGGCLTRELVMRVCSTQAMTKGRAATEIVAEADAGSGFEQVFQHGFQRPLFRRAVELGRRSV